MLGNKKSIIKYLDEQPENKLFDINEHSDKRSGRANRYYWSLINELAGMLRISKEELHFKMLQEYGTSTIVEMDSIVDIERFIKYYKPIAEETRNGKKYIQYIIYIESHKMNRKQFSILLDGLVTECRIQNIPTLEDKEIQEMMKYYEIK